MNKNIIQKFNETMNNATASATEQTAITLDVCNFVAHSVLKKIIQVSNDSKCKEMKRGLMEHETNMKCFHELNNASVTLSYNADGDLIRTVDSELSALASEKLDYMISDGCDLVNECYVFLMEEIAKQLDRDGCIDLEKPYTKTIQNKKVVITDNDSKALYKEIETTPIQECFKHVRQYIMKSGNFTTASHKFTYIETETEKGDSVYKRINQIDIGQAVNSSVFNGNATVNTCNADDLENITNSISELELSAQQKTIIKYRLRGYGYKAIATALNVRERSIKVQCKRIKAKAEKLGYTVGQLTEKDSYYQNGKANKNLLSESEMKARKARNERVKAITEKYDNLIKEWVVNWTEKTAK